MAYLQIPDPDGDPGYIESLKIRTRLAELRKIGLLVALAPMVVFLGVTLMVHQGKTAAWTLVLPLLAAGGAFAACWQLRQSLPAIPAGTAPSEARTTALNALRQSVRVRLAITGVPFVVGLVCSLVSGSLLPYAVAFLATWPQLLRSLPDQRTIEDVRARLEAQGVDSQLWAVLSEPVGAVHRRV